MKKLIIGLGNPGKEYETTKHNVGFLVLDEYAKTNNFEISKSKFSGLFAKERINNQDVIFLKPTTYMNLSGIAIKEAMNFYKIDIKDVLIIFDDKDIKLGSFKLKDNGSAGGHNGIKNIINTLGTQEFNRLKIGIGTGHKIEDIKNFVLKNFSKKDFELISNNYSIYVDIIEDFLTSDFKTLQGKYNGK